LLFDGRAALCDNITAGGDSSFERSDQAGVVGCIGDPMVGEVGFFGFCH
jgi:hypothetical protein